ncbi:MAG: hypothetical protein HUU50_10235 [Candidatus Brocadiae bacterium]|nr:hypothetical protein [Candidatus Brocadiia bacterium]
MERKIFFIQFVLGLLFLSGCASSAYYNAAVKTQPHPIGCVEYLNLCLAESPAHEEALAMKKEISHSVAADLSSKCASVENKDPDKSLKFLDRLILFGNLAGMPISKEQEKRGELAKKASEIFYQKGLSLFGGDISRISTVTKEITKQGVKFFRTCLGFYPGYKEAQDWYQKCVESAIERIVILDFHNPYPNFSGLSNNLTSSSLSKLMERRPELLEFLSRDQFKNLHPEIMIPDLSSGIMDTNLFKDVKGANYIVAGKILSVIPTDTGWQEQDQKNTIKIGVYNDKGKRIGEESVTAWWTLKSRKTSLAIKASYEVIDVYTTKIRKKSTLGNSFVDSQVYLASFGGDERALPSEIRAISTSPQEPKNHLELCEIIVDKMAESFSKELFSDFMIK